MSKVYAKGTGSSFTVARRNSSSGARLEPLSDEGKVKTSSAAHPLPTTMKRTPSGRRDVPLVAPSSSAKPSSVTTAKKTVPSSSTAGVGTIGPVPTRKASTTRMTTTPPTGSSSSTFVSDSDSIAKKRQAPAMGVGKGSSTSSTMMRRPPANDHLVAPKKLPVGKSSTTVTRKPDSAPNAKLTGTLGTDTYSQQKVKGFMLADDDNDDDSIISPSKVAAIYDGTTSGSENSSPNTSPAHRSNQEKSKTEDATQSTSSSLRPSGGPTVPMPPSAANGQSKNPAGGVSPTTKKLQASSGPVKAGTGAVSPSKASVNTHRVSVVDGVTTFPPQYLHTAPWPDLTAERQQILDGETMEKPFTDETLVRLLPREAESGISGNLGYFACVRCKKVIASLSSKVPVDGGYIAFKAFQLANVSIELLFVEGETKLLGKCNGCQGLLGCLQRGIASSRLPCGEVLRVNSLSCHFVSDKKAPGVTELDRNSGDGENSKGIRGQNGTALSQEDADEDDDDDFDADLFDDMDLVSGSTSLETKLEKRHNFKKNWGTAFTNDPKAELPSPGRKVVAPKQPVTVANHDVKGMRRSRSLSDSFFCVQGPQQRY